jgi:hypothetical protein
MTKRKLMRIILGYMRDPANRKKSIIHALPLPVPSYHIKAHVEYISPTAPYLMPKKRLASPAFPEYYICYNMLCLAQDDLPTHGPPYTSHDDKQKRESRHNTQACIHIRGFPLQNINFDNPSRHGSQAATEAVHDTL